MFKHLTPILVLGLAATGLGAVAPDSPLSFVTLAHAKNEKSGDHGGNGGGGGGGEHGGKGSGGKSEKSGSGNGKSSSSTGKGKTVSGPGKTHSPKSSTGKATKAAASPNPQSAEEEEIDVAFEVDNPGKFASELKGLNAYHASEQAWQNASPNSRVGRIAAYREAALTTTENGRLAEEAAAAVSEKEDIRDGIQQEISDLDANYAAKNAEIDEKIGALDPDAEDYDAQVAALEAERPSATDYETQKVELQGKLATAEESLTASEAELADAEEAAGTAAQTEDEALLAATDGRVLSDEALAYFREKIGLGTP